MVNNQPYATYDYNGNQLAGGGRTNVWDSQNRLFSCTYDNVTSAFAYGADGLRRSMTVGNNPTVHYALDGQNVVQEGHLDQGDFVTDVTYLLGPRGIEYRKDTSGVSWYLYDGLGSVVAEVDEAGIVTATRKYDVYGGLRDSTGTGGDQKFCGSLGHAQEDSTGPTGSGLIYMRARWMDPVTGRFVSEDPAYDGLNWYAYCGNNPVNLFDMDGNKSAAGTINRGLEVMEPASRAVLLYGLGSVMKMNGMRNISQGMGLMMEGFVTRLASNALWVDPFGTGGAAAESAGIMMEAMGGIQAKSGVGVWLTGVMMQQAAKYIDGLGNDVDDLFSGLWHHVVNPVF